MSASLVFFFSLARVARHAAETDYSNRLSISYMLMPDVLY